MAVKNFETLNTSTDITTTRTLLHEAIPLTGSIISGTYFETYTPTGDTNIKNYTHGMFQSVYDYPYLSSSANHIFDLSIGYASTSGMSSSANEQNAKKINMYNVMAQSLLGYDVSGNIETFESDLDLTDNDAQMKEVFFINFSRLLTKDQVKKGSFSLTLGTASWSVSPFPTTPVGVTLTDLSASDDGGTNPNVNGGEYGLLYHSPFTASAVGAVFYQAGVAVVTASVFASGTTNISTTDGQDQFADNNATMYGITGSWTDLPISSSCDAIRRRIYNLSFNNTTELNSTVYFCRAPSTKFNYSANPTYTTGSKLRVKNVASDTPLSYVTTVGLYNSSNELLAVAKLSEPLKKDPTNEITLRVRLDY
jgi:hypothetical protein